MHSVAESKLAAHFGGGVGGCSLAGIFSARRNVKIGGVADRVGANLSLTTLNLQPHSAFLHLPPLEPAFTVDALNVLFLVS